MVDEGKEPGNWELMRGIQRIEQSMRDLATTMVTADLYRAGQESNERRFLEHEEDIKQLRAEMAAKGERDQSREDDGRRLKFTVTMSSIMAGFAIVVSVVLHFIPGGM